MAPREYTNYIPVCVCLYLGHFRIFVCIVHWTPIVQTKKKQINEHYLDMVTLDLRKGGFFT